MIICGIDYSVNSPAITKLILDENLDIIDSDYLGFTSVKSKANKHIKYYHSKNTFKWKIEQMIWMRDEIFEFIKDVDYAAIEDYALRALGKVFNISEATGMTLTKLFENNIPYRKYDPNSIKMHFTDNGAAKKNLMCIHYLKKEHQLKEFKFNLDNISSPVEDVVDSYAVGTLLQLELKLRKGIIKLRSLTEKQIQIFNRCTKSNPTNILARDFVFKEKKSD